MWWSLPKVEIIGAGELAREFAKLGELNVEQTTLRAARNVEREARARAPKLTGRLARSIRTRLFRNRTRGVVAAEVAPGPEAPYAPIVEQRQPFMAPAADSKQLDVERVFVAAVDAAIKGERG